MKLSKEEKDKIQEEETLRIEARIQAHERLGNKQRSCSVCGNAPGCRGCRIFGFIFAAIVILGLLRFFGGHDDCRRFYGHDRSNSGELGQSAQQQAPQNIPGKE